MANKVIVIGGGLAGLMASLKAVEAGMDVQIFSVVPVKRSHSVCAQGGINGALHTKGDGDNPAQHFYDTIYGGDFLANQTAAKNMCDAAPRILELFDRMGVPFTRTPEGNLDFRHFGGQKLARTAFAGASTGQQLMYAIDEQIRRLEDQGKVEKYENWEFIGTIIEDNKCAGIVAQNMFTMDIKAFPADAVIVATGGLGVIFGRSTNSTINNGSAAGIVYAQGAKYANAEFIQIHPTAIPGDDKNRLMSESARGEGGRIWTYKDGKPWYFLEEMYPAYGNLVPRDIATRAIFSVCIDQKLGINGENQVYLDLTHIDSHELDRKLGAILEIYEQFVGDDPRKVPMRIFPSVHYTMGGIWSDFNTHMTNIPGLFACGECEYSYHGANRLGANSLLSAIYSGSVAGPAAAEYIKGLSKSAAADANLLAAEEKKYQQEYTDILAMRGTENPFVLHDEMGTIMTENVTVVRDNKKLANTLEILKDFKERYKNINCTDQSLMGNQTALHIRRLKYMINLAELITAGALARNESRGAHYKPDFPERNDEEWLKTTIGTYSEYGPILSYEEIELSHIKPVKRVYDVDNTSGKGKELEDKEEIACEEGKE